MKNKIYKDSQDENHRIVTAQDYMGGWHAYTDNYDGAPDAGPQRTGDGTTEQNAIDDLIKQIEDELPCEI